MLTPRLLTTRRRSKIEADGVFRVAGVVMEIRFHGKVANQDELGAWVRQLDQQIGQGQVTIQSMSKE